jgi:branched-chain amino acid transport system permease protein
MELPSGIYNISYSQDIAVIRTKLQSVLTAFLFCLLAIIPFFASMSIVRLLIYMGITTITAQGLNIMLGYCGQVSLGHTAFMAVGAYASGILAINIGLPFWLSVPIGGLMGGLAGVILGLPCLRVKGFYLALATLGAQIIIGYAILHTYDITGGSDGLLIPQARIGGFILNSVEKFYFVITITVVIMTAMAKNLVRARIGRAFIAIRDNEIAAEAMGVHIHLYKVLAFFVGCFYAGVAGSLWVYYLGAASPEMFTLMDSIWYLGILAIGGIGSISGAIFGSIFVRALEHFVNNFLAPIIGATFPSISASLSAALAPVFFGALVVLFLVYEPRGLTHSWEILWSRYRLHPFKDF